MRRRLSCQSSLHDFSFCLPPSMICHVNHFQEQHRGYLLMGRILGLLAFALSALPQANAASLLVRGGTLIDGTGGSPIANARILITDGRIARVWSGDAGAPSLPTGTEIVEAGGKFIIPGLIDSHVH